MTKKYAGLMAGIDQEEGDKFDPMQIAKKKAEGRKVFEEAKALKLEESKKGLKLAMDSKKVADATKDLSKVKQAGLSMGAGLASDAITGGGTTTDEGAGAAGGILTGAASGAAFGAPGAIIGGAIGGISGALGAAEARKQKLAKIEAEKQKALGDIAERKAEKLQSAFSNLGASLSGLF